MDYAIKDGETLVIVTADHETGGLTLPSGNIKEGTMQAGIIADIKPQSLIEEPTAAIMYHIFSEYKEKGINFLNMPRKSARHIILSGVINALTEGRSEYRTPFPRR